MKTLLNTLSIKEITRTNLFYNQYDTCIRVPAQAIGFTRYYTNAAELWNRNRSSVGWRQTDSLTEIACYRAFNLKAVIEQFERSLSKRVKFMKQTNSLYIYLNLTDSDTVTEVLDVLEAHGFTHDQAEHITEVHPETMYMSKPPEYRYRLYARPSTLKNAVEFRSELSDFLARYRGTIRPCAALERWLSDTRHAWYHTQLSNSYFVEFDTASTQVLIALNLPQLAGKRYELVHRV